ncbi:hypothetical protein ACOZB2_24235 [Pantoea endophytica]
MQDALTPALSRKRARELIERLVGEVIYLANIGGIGPRSRKRARELIERLVGEVIYLANIGGIGPLSH